MDRGWSNVTFDAERVVDDASRPTLVVGQVRPGRGDRRPTRVSTAVAAAVLVALVAAVAVTVAGEDDRDLLQPLVASAPEGPEVSGVDDSMELVEGFGEWSALPSGPSGLASGFTDGRELSDGRLLFWGTDAAPSPGDTPESVDGLVGSPSLRATPVAMAIYSPADRSWSTVGTAPLEEAEILGFRWAAGRLLTWGARSDGTDLVAVYDPVADRWIDSTVPGTSWELFDGVA